MPAVEPNVSLERMCWSNWQERDPECREPVFSQGTVIAEKRLWEYGESILRTVSTAKQLNTRVKSSEFPG